MFPLKKKLQLLLSSQLAREFAMVIGAARHLIWAISTVQILPVANALGDGGMTTKYGNHIYLQLLPDSLFLLLL